VRKKSIESGEESSAEWKTREAFARQGVQRLLQRVLEEEVDELLGRGGTSGEPASIRLALLSQRLRETAAAELEQRDDHAPATAGARAGRALGEPAAAGVPTAHGRSRPPPARAVPARVGPRRLRPGLARAAWRWRAAVGFKRSTPPVRNELSRRLFGNGEISPEDDWTFELIPEEILGPPAGTIGAEELDLSEIQDVVLSMEYDITPGGP
jgi:hypothetical protein